MSTKLPWQTVRLLHLVKKPVSPTPLVVEYRVSNKAGDEFTFTAKATGAWRWHRNQSANTFFILRQPLVSNHQRRHSIIVSDTQTQATTCAMVELVSTSDIWLAPEDNFEHLVLFTNIIRPIEFEHDPWKGHTSMGRIVPPPHDISPYLRHHTTFGSTAIDDEAAMLLKLGLVNYNMTKTAIYKDDPEYR